MVAKAATPGGISVTPETTGSGHASGTSAVVDINVHSKKVLD